MVSAPRSFAILVCIPSYVDYRGGHERHIYDNTTECVNGESSRKLITQFTVHNFHRLRTEELDTLLSEGGTSLLICVENWAENYQEMSNRLMILTMSSEIVGAPSIRSREH